MRNKEWLVNEGKKDEYILPNNKCKLTIEEYSDGKGVLFVIEYTMCDPFCSKIYNKQIFKSRNEGKVQYMFNHYIDLLGIMADSLRTFNKHFRGNK